MKYDILQCIVTKDAKTCVREAISDVVKKYKNYVDSVDSYKWESIKVKKRSKRLVKDKDLDKKKKIVEEYNNNTSTIKQDEFNIIDEVWFQLTFLIFGADHVGKLVYIQWKRFVRSYVLDMKKGMHTWKTQIGDFQQYLPDYPWHAGDIEGKVVE